MPDPFGFTVLAQALVDLVLDGLQQVQVQENIGLGNVNNTSDANKPVSTAQAAAIANAVSAAIAALTKASVGLNSVDNTSDANKPVSVAQAAAIALKLALAGGTMTGPIVLSGDPTNVLHPATKQYSDLKVPLAGGTMTGLLVLSGPPTTGLHPATKTYVDTADALKAPINNAVFTGTTTLAADPGTALQAATKQYVDATVNALLDAANAEQFKGIIDCSANPNWPVANSGWVYKVSVAGRIGGASGQIVEIGDRLQCIVDGSAAGNDATVGANWWITQANVGFSSNGVSLVTAANYAAMKVLLAYTMADITDASANGRSLVTAASYAAMKTLLAYTMADITDASANGRSLITAANYAAMRTLLAMTVADLTDASANGRSLISAANYAAMRTLLAITVADLTDATANGRSLISSTNYASMRTLLTLNNVDNTSDVNKPVSTAQQTAISAIGARMGGNILDNPDGLFNQRGAITNTNSTFGHDRWKALVQTAAIAISTVTDVENNSPFMMRLTQSQVTAQRMGYIQFLSSPRSKLMRGATLTLSARVRCSASQTLRYAILEWTGTADAVTTDVVNSWTNGTYTAGQFFVGASVTVTGVGSIALVANTLTDITALTVTLGSTGNNVGVFFWTEATAAQNVTLDIKAQLEVGAVASPFRKRVYSDELLNVTQFYRKSFDLNTAPVQGVGTAGTITFGQVAAGAVNQVCPWIPFGALMSKTPTVTTYNPSAANAEIRGGTGDWSATTVVQACPHGFTITATSVAGSSSGQFSRIHYTAEAELMN